jgi:hypothetical protein
MAYTTTDVQAALINHDPFLAAEMEARRAQRHNVAAEVASVAVHSVLTEVSDQGGEV